MSSTLSLSHTHHHPHSLLLRSSPSPTSFFSPPPRYPTPSLAPTPQSCHPHLPQTPTIYYETQHPLPTQQLRLDACLPRLPFQPAHSLFSGRWLPLIRYKCLPDPNIEAGHISAIRFTYSWQRPIWHCCQRPCWLVNPSLNSSQAIIKECILMYPDVCNKYQVYEKTTRRRHSTGQLLRLGLPPFPPALEDKQTNRGHLLAGVRPSWGLGYLRHLCQGCHQSGTFQSWLFSAFYKDTGKIFSLTVKYVQIWLKHRSVAHLNLPSRGPCCRL